MDYQDITVRVYVTGSPEIKVIKPESGSHAGEETFVLNFRAVEPKYKKQSDGTFKRVEGIFYSVRLFGDAAKQVGALIQDGMLLEVKGSFYKREYTTREGQTRTDNVINADKVALPLQQPGLKGIDFEKRETKKSA